jgi:short subunit dehydrogenase-like uncharacterized protein
VTASRTYDVVLFGASGFTGGLTAHYLARAGAKRPLSWALAGRNREKLAAVRARLAQIDARAGQIEILVVDASDSVALRAMAQSTRVMASTVGPYIRYGEPLVRACAENGTHYVDLTGEPEFVDGMIERYHATAAHNRAKIVNSCGFDSIPHDLGAYFTVKQLAALMGGESRGSLREAKVVVEGFVRATGTFSGGTWHSALTIMGRLREYERERKQHPLQLETIGQGRSISQLPLRIAQRKEIGAWAVPIPTIDPQVVCRSARLLPEYGREFSYGHYAAVRHLPTLVFGIGGLGVLFALAQWKPTRSLLLNFRQPGDGPDAHTREKSWFRVRFVARAGEQRVMCEVRGGDPGYDETAKMLAESALCLAQDEGLPQHFGVVPPAAAMGDALIARLQAAGIAFEVSDQPA